MFGLPLPIVFALFVLFLALIAKYVISTQEPWLRRREKKKNKMEEQEERWNAHPDFNKK